MNSALVCELRVRENWLCSHGLDLRNSAVTTVVDNFVREINLAEP